MGPIRESVPKNKQRNGIIDTNVNPMVTTLVAELQNETVQAIDYKKNEKEEVKIPLPEQVIGGSSKTFSVVISTELFTEYGLDETEIETLRALTAKLRTHFVSVHGESSGFNSKKGTTIVATLKSLQSMAEQGVGIELTAADQTAISEATASWYANAPLRGRAALVNMTPEQREAHKAKQEAKKALKEAKAATEDVEDNN